MDPLVGDPAWEPGVTVHSYTLANLGVVRWKSGVSEPATYRSADVFELPKFNDIVKDFKFFRVNAIDLVVSACKPKINLLTLTSNKGGDMLPKVAGPVPEYTQIEVARQFVRTIRISNKCVKKNIFNAVGTGKENPELSLFIQIAPAFEGVDLDRVIFEYVIKYRIEATNDPVTLEC
jgi:hypothetical protein